MTDEQGFTPARLIEIREALALDRRGLAAALGYHERSVRNWEEGRRPTPRVVRLALMALLAGVPDPADLAPEWIPVAFEDIGGFRAFAAEMAAQASDA